MDGPASLILLGSVIRAGNFVVAQCLDCWNLRVLDADALSKRYGSQVTLGEIARRLVCRCGSRRCQAGVRLKEMGTIRPDD